MKYQIRPLNTGTVVSDPKTYFYHHSIHPFYREKLTGTTQVPCFAFLITGKEHRILVDTGMSDTERAGKYHHPGSVQAPGEAIYEQLEKIGVRCEEITHVIFTHLHWDHVYYCDRFVNAKFYAQRSEYEYAQNPIPIYHKSYEDKAIGLAKKQFDGLSITLIDDEEELLPGIRTYLTPGHSVGHQVVEVDTADGVYTLVGDAIFTLDNLTPIPEIAYDVSPVARYVDINAWWHSAVKIKNRMVDIDHILGTHDVKLLERIKTQPVLGGGDVP